MENSLREKRRAHGLTTQLIRLKDQTHSCGTGLTISSEEDYNVDDGSQGVPEIRIRFELRRTRRLGTERTVNSGRDSMTTAGYHFYREAHRQERDRDVQSISKDSTQMIPPMDWLGNGCLGRATAGRTEGQSLWKRGRPACAGSS